MIFDPLFNAVNDPLLTQRQGLDFLASANVPWFSLLSSALSLCGLRRHAMRSPSSHVVSPRDVPRADEEAAHSAAVGAMPSAP